MCGKAISIFTNIKLVRKVINFCLLYVIVMVMACCLSAVYKSMLSFVTRLLYMSHRATQYTANKLYHFRFYLTSLSIMNVSCTPLLSYCWFHSTLGPSDRFLYQDYVMLVAHCTQLRFIVLEHASCIIDHAKKYSWV